MQMSMTLVTWDKQKTTQGLNILIHWRKNAYNLKFPINSQTVTADFASL